MKLSACYITKNEEKTLARSLDSIREQVDEIVVLDTGSTDHTKEIAKKYGTMLYDFVWQDDFSAARNQALQYVTGDWVVFLDADEYFTTATAGSLRAAIERRAEQDALLLKRLDIGENETEVLVDVFVLRIFRNRPELRYRGRIHEELCESGGDIRRLGAVPADELLLLHTGYQQQVNRQKAERNLRILEKELAETKEPGRLYMYLAEACLGIGRRQEARRYAWLDIRQGRRPIVYASRSWHVLLQILAREPGAAAERRQVAELAVKDFPELPEFHAELAVCLAQAQDYAGAVRELRQAMDCAVHDTGLEPRQFAMDMQKLCQSHLFHWQQIVERLPQIRISACVIARDEAGEIGIWLKSAKCFADEIIFVDTGSADDTLAQAQAAGVRSFSFPWHQDFSAARNFALEQAGGDWIIFLDADETFYHPERVRGQLAALEVEHPAAGIVSVPLVSVDADAEDLEIQRFPAVRIWRSSPELRYAGRVHETLCQSGQALPRPFFAQSLAVRHTGYSSARVRQKLERDLQLLYKEIEEIGEQPQHYRYLADCCYGLGEYELALRYAELALEKGPADPVWRREACWRAIYARQKLERPLPEQLAFVERMCRIFPEAADLQGVRGILLYRLGQYPQSRALLENFCQAVQPGGEKEVSFAQSIWGEACTVLALLLRQAGELSKAEELLDDALRKDPYCVETLACAREFYPEPAAFFAKVLPFYAERDKGLRFITRQAEAAGAVSLLLYAGQNLLPHEWAGSASRAWQLAAAHSLPELENELQTEMPQAVQSLFFSLVSLEQGWCRDHAQRFADWLAMLPESLQRVIARLQGGPSLQETDWDGYLAGLTILQQFAARELMLRYAPLALDFSWARVREAAKKLAELEAWQAAFVLYEAVPQEQTGTDGEFWHETGICLYALGEKAAAAECFERAVAEGCCAKDIKAYQSWIGKENGHD